MRKNSMSQQIGRTIVVSFSIAVATVCADLRADDPFPKASPEAHAMSAEAIGLLGEHIVKLVEKDAVVGAELHLIKNRRTVFQQAYGWADREEQRRLEPDSIFCVRSMTKPLVGTAIQMLMDEGKLSLQQRVADILPSFDRPKTREITIQHLLTHSSGLPFTTISQPLAEYSSLADVAAGAANVGLEFEPGTSFQYSDAGSDTLGAVVAAVTGSPAEDFIVSRILKPLGMDDSLTLLARADDRTSRIPSAYSGGDRNWQRHWKSSDPPIFPLFLTSQSLYCTTTDYARFLTLWMDGGQFHGRALLSPEAVNRALSPGRRIGGFSNGFENCERTYGQQWMVYHGEESPQTVIFGHNGSDGTHAWAWPQQDLIVLFFTQSRGTLAGVELESVIDRLLIKVDVEGYRRDMRAKEAAQKSFERYEGIYWDETAEAVYYAVMIEEDQLVVERPGRFRAEANPQRDEGKFSLYGGAIKLEFESGTETAAAMLMKTLRESERQIRHQPDPNLPTIDDLMADVREAHGIDRLKDAGVIMLSGTIKMGLLGRQGKIRQWFDSRRSRTEIELGSTTMIVVTVGSDASASTGGGPLQPLEGLARQQEVLAHPAIQYGGWRRNYAQLEVLKQVESEQRTLVLVRAKATGMPNATIVVDADTGLIVGGKSLPFVPGAGFVGLDSAYRDYREVAGIKLPFYSEARFANPLLGRVVIQFNASEIRVDEADLFHLPSD
jgi:CubicO group peptidase (beta-lactamase class C family)